MADVAMVAMRPLTGCFAGAGGGAGGAARTGMAGTGASAVRRRAVRPLAAPRTATGKATRTGGEER